MVVVRQGSVLCQMRSDPGDQCAPAERLGQVAVGANLEADHPIDRPAIAVVAISSEPAGSSRASTLQGPTCR